MWTRERISSSQNYLIVFFYHCFWEEMPMRWLVDIDAAIEDDTLTAEAGAELKRRARGTMIDFAINLVLFAGVVMVIAGAATWLKDRLTLATLGAVVAAVGIFAIIVGGTRLRLMANATAMIGVTLAVGALADLLFQGQTDRVALGAALGLPTILLGWFMRRSGPAELSSLGGWILLLGATVHLTGILTTQSQHGLAWLALHYAGAVVIVCGVVLNVRFVTAIAMVPLAASLSSRTFYQHASYGVAIYEVSLTILQMSLLSALAFVVAARVQERFARHARLLGELALIWINMAFWIGSLWGDVVGKYLWGPRWNIVTEGLNASEKYTSWRAAVESFKAHAITIPADFFAAVWAVSIVAAAAWGAWTARRGVLNIAVTFGAIHFYTQYFERLKATPVAIIIAGVIAIFAAWALWMVNQKLVSVSPQDRTNNG
jgi:hypothetical protein